jgi:hypothetical protein
MGKGSLRRPSDVPAESFAERWERTFGGGQPQAFPDLGTPGFVLAARLFLREEARQRAAAFCSDDFDAVRDAYERHLGRVKKDMERIGEVTEASRGTDP